MGIKNFLSKFETKLLNQVEHFDSIFIDGNYLLYNLIYCCNNDEDLTEKVKNFIYFFDEKIIIKKYVFIIFDGECEYINEFNPKNFKKRKFIKSDDYDKQPIKPKTEIIYKFKTMLINEIKNKIKKKYLSNFEIIVDDDYNNGEGDIKILKHINNYKTKKNCVISSDSDMILINSSLCLKHNIEIELMINPKKRILVIYKDYYEKYGQDFILIMLLLGNDYLPKLSNIDFEILLDTYKKYIKVNEKIIQNNKMEMNHFLKYIYTLIYFIKKNKNKKLSFSLNKINLERIEIYYNNISWCLKLYNLIDNENKYIEDKIGDKVINIYNFYFLK